MRTIRETLPIDDAIAKYPAGTEFVALVSQDFRKGELPDGLGYYGLKNERTTDIESAHVWKIEDVSNWGDHMLACILTTAEEISTEEISKMTLGQRVAYEIERATSPKAVTCLTSKDVLQLAKQQAKQIDNSTSLSFIVVLAALGNIEFRERFLTEAEHEELLDLVRKSQDHFRTIKPMTPNQRIIGAVTKTPNDTAF